MKSLCFSLLLILPGGFISASPSSLDSVQQPAKQPPEPPVPQPTEQRININTATAEELTRLPGIGPALAARIIAHRDKHGPFKRPQEIIVVRGISARRYRQIAHLIRT